MAFEILQAAVHTDAELVRHNAELPALVARGSSAHQRIAPIHTSARCDVQIETLIEARVGELSSPWPYIRLRGGKPGDVPPDPRRPQ